MPGLVHVSGYQQRRDGHLVDVADYDRGAPAGGGKKLSPEQAYESYLDSITKAEGSKGKPHGGFREINPKTRALGAYQLQPDALRDIGWKDADGHWTKLARAHGVNSDQAFLTRPAAQKAAMRVYTRRNREQLVANGSMEHIGKEYVSPNHKQFVVTEAGLAAAAHRSGARATKKVLEKLASKAAGNSPDFDRNELATITRLREFGDGPYATP